MTTSEATYRPGGRVQVLPQQAIDRLRSKTEAEKSPTVGPLVSRGTVRDLTAALDTQSRASLSSPGSKQSTAQRLTRELIDPGKQLLADDFRSSVTHAPTRGPDSVIRVHHTGPAPDLKFSPKVQERPHAVEVDEKGASRPITTDNLVFGRDDIRKAMYEDETFDDARLEKRPRRLQLLDHEGVFHIRLADGKWVQAKAATVGRTSPTIPVDKHSGLPIYNRGKDVLIMRLEGLGKSDRLAMAAEFEKPEHPTAVAISALVGKDVNPAIPTNTGLDCAVPESIVHLQAPQDGGCCTIL